MMTKLPDLDPEYKKATQRLNRFFSEELKDTRQVSVEHLLWYLSTTLLWKELDNGIIQELKDRIVELEAECERSDSIFWDRVASIYGKDNVAVRFAREIDEALDD